MHPYRDAPMRDDRSSTSRSAEELILYAVLVAIGVIPVAIALARHARFGAEETIGLLMVAVGAFAFAHALRRHRRRSA